MRRTLRVVAFIDAVGRVVELAEIMLLDVGVVSSCTY
jgi:hypothetical protein